MLNQYKHVEVNYIPEKETAVWKIKTEGIPNFTLEGLREFTRFSEDLKIMFTDNSYPLKYLVSCSGHNEVYNLGGDLPYFLNCIKTKDREGLREYAHLSIDAIYNIYTAFNLSAVSIALVEGNAYGGGFECAMAHDLIISNSKAKFCLPENKFNLFPGMGAYSFLCRKLNFKTASEILYGGNVYSSREMFDFGLIDQINDNTTGVDSITSYIDKIDRNYNFNHSHFQCLKKVFPLQKKELLEITNIWVEACLKMNTADLRRMELIVNAQNRKIKQTL
ncbi:DSF synthase [Tenacibaculum sp. MAR_2009_124]|uniref:crotonase/enoyl-CoA hydratase family protein n=1 Tax=Tenacibaculum sp. MAR_2009_124 TaxID=1250059 RepID=UPI0008953998|nr:crotonase/enoyl-CoA hydratase family protein [Tenacibaculum sp. MAR_2009_124]SEB44423.1 DSF synthase [Tenacibaculum sp. MAR_2009_124]